MSLLTKSEVASYIRVVGKSELAKMGADSAAILALAAKPGYVFSGSVEGRLTDSTSGGHHGFDPKFPEMMTGFIAAGAGINKGMVIEEMCVTEIAPLIAKLLGLTIAAPDGKLIPGLIKNK
jgi:hypothetical protein